MFQLTAHCRHRGRRPYHTYRSHVPADCSDTEGEDHHTYRSYFPDDCSDTEGEKEHHTYRSHIPAQSTSPGEMNQRWPVPTHSPTHVQFIHLSSHSEKEEQRACIKTKQKQHVIVQELCESRGGRPGLSVLTSLLVSVDVKNY